MTPLQLELTKLIGREDLTFGCYVQKNKHWSNSDEPLLGRITSDPSDFDTGYQMGFNAEHMGTYSTTVFGTYILNDKNEDGTKKWEIIGHPATLSDFHRWMNENGNNHGYREPFTQLNDKITFWDDKLHCFEIPYNSSKDLLDQDEETLKQIRDLIISNQ